MLLIVAFACFAVLLSMWLIMPERASSSVEAGAADPFGAETSTAPARV